MAHRPQPTAPPRKPRVRRPADALLRQLYHDEKLTQGEIAEKLGTHATRVRRWMAAAGIDTRLGASAQRRVLDAQPAEQPAPTHRQGEAPHSRHEWTQTFWLSEQASRQHPWVQKRLARFRAHCEQIREFEEHEEKELL